MRTHRLAAAAALICIGVFLGWGCGDDSTGETQSSGGGNGQGAAGGSIGNGGEGGGNQGGAPPFSCDPQGSDPECFACTKENCCAEAEACEPDDVCGPCLACLNSHPDDPATCAVGARAICDQSNAATKTFFDCAVANCPVCL
jgi:hypothetical protein